MTRSGVRDGRSGLAGSERNPTDWAGPRRRTFTVESWWRTGGIESTLGIVFETSSTYFERGNQLVIQMLEELSHEKSDCA